MSTITNLNAVKTLLAADVSSTVSTTTSALLVMSSDTGATVVQSGANGDLQVKLRGVSIPAGSSVTVDLASGEVLVVAEAPKPAAKAPAPKTRGCADASFMVR